MSKTHFIIKNSEGKEFTACGRPRTRVKQSSKRWSGVRCRKCIRHPEYIQQATLAQNNSCDAWRVVFKNNQHTQTYLHAAEYLVKIYGHSLSQIKTWDLDKIISEVVIGFVAADIRLQAYKEGGWRYDTDTIATKMIAKERVRIKRNTDIQRAEDFCKDPDGYDEVYIPYDLTPPFIQQGEAQ